MKQVLIAKIEETIETRKKRIEEIIDNNNIDSEYKPLVKVICKLIYEFLPNYSFKNLKRNIADLKIEFAIFEPKDSREELGGYYSYENKILLNEKLKNDPDKLTHVLTHELIHVASARVYEKTLDKGISRVGFCETHNINEKKYFKIGYALNEGVTELITRKILKDDFMGWSYEPQVLMANMILSFTDEQKFYESFFAGDLEKLQSMISKIDNNQEKFENIIYNSDAFLVESNKKPSEKQKNYLADMQKTCIKYFTTKLKQDIKEKGLSFDEIKERVQKFNSYLITDGNRSKLNIRDDMAGKLDTVLPAFKEGINEILDTYKTFEKKNEVTLKKTKTMTGNGYIDALIISLITLGMGLIGLKIIFLAM